MPEGPRRRNAADAPATFSRVILALTRRSGADRVYVAMFPRGRADAARGAHRVEHGLHHGLAAVPRRFQRAAFQRRGTAAGVSSLYYLVPPATAVEAYLLFGETVGGLSLIGIGVTALGVALVVVPPRGGRTAQAGSSPE